MYASDNMNENIASHIIKEINEIPMILNRNLRSIDNIKYHKRDDFDNESTHG